MRHHKATMTALSNGVPKMLRITSPTNTSSSNDLVRANRTGLPVMRCDYG